MAKRKFYYKKENKPQKLQNVYDPQMEQKAKSVLIDDLSLSEVTCALLKKNNFKQCSDLVVRTEKDMYKIQNFGKKHLIEISKALKSKGFCFATLPASAPKAVKENAKQSSKDSQKQKSNIKAALPEKRAEQKHTKEPTEILPNRKFFTLSGKLRQGEGRPRYDHTESKPVSSVPYPPTEWRKVQRGTKWGFYDGVKNVIEPKYDEVFSFKEGLACVELDEKCGFIDEKNNVVIPFEYESALSFSEGYAVVVKDGKCGYIDKKNNLVIAFDFDAATPFEGGTARVKKDGRWGVVDTNGSVKWNAK